MNETPGTMLEKPAEALRQVGREVERLADAAATDLERELPVDLTSGALLLSGGALALVGAGALLCGLVLTTRRPARSAFVLGALACAGAGAFAFVGVSALPKRPMKRTRRELGEELEEAGREVKP